MKKIILFFCCMLFITGCKRNNENDIINEINKKIENSNNYQMVSTLDIYRNEEKFSYDVVSTYKKDNLFKVQLINKQNQHEQIILKNNNSVYVITPSLNKSFKFQSEWPYNNSQIYLLQPILMDIKNDKNSEFKNIKDGYLITSKANYSTEKDYKKQKIYFDNQKNMVKVEIVNSKDEIKMSLNIISIKYNIDLDKKIFDAENYITYTKDDNTSNGHASYIKDVIYPLYIPEETYLVSQDIVEIENGERVILTFSGESKFTLIQETLDKNNQGNFVYGDPYLILDTVGSITDSSVSWISNDVEYTVISDNIDIDELLTVAQSISVKPIDK